MHLDLCRQLLSQDDPDAIELAIATLEVYLTHTLPVDVEIDARLLLAEIYLTYGGGNAEAVLSKGAVRVKDIIQRLRINELLCRIYTGNLRKNLIKTSIALCEERDLEYWLYVFLLKDNVKALHAAALKRGHVEMLKLCKVYELISGIRRGVKVTCEYELQTGCLDIMLLGLSVLQDKDKAKLEKLHRMLDAGFERSFDVQGIRFMVGEELLAFMYLLSAVVTQKEKFVAAARTLTPKAAFHAAIMYIQHNKLDAAEKELDVLNGDKKHYISACLHQARGNLDKALEHFDQTHYGITNAKVIRGDYDVPDEQLAMLLSSMTESPLSKKRILTEVLQCQNAQIVMLALFALAEQSPDPADVRLMYAKTAMGYQKRTSIWSLFYAQLSGKDFPIDSLPTIYSILE